MPLVEYFLLALLGSTPVAGATTPRSFDADAVTQPSGGTPNEMGATLGASNSNKPAATSGKKGHKSGKKGHKGGKKSKKGSSTTTPPPK